MVWESMAQERHRPGFPGKDLGHFTYKSAHRKSTSSACGFAAQTLRLQCYIIM